MKKINWTRPLSPHLTIYITEINSLISILNRIFSTILTSLILCGALTPKLLILGIQTCLGNLIATNILCNFFYLVFLYALIFHMCISITHMASENKKITKVCFVCLIFITISCWI